jgi:hypothetical protein
VPNDRIVAVGLLTSTDLELLGTSFDRVWPIEEAPAFPDLLRAIDEADRQSQASNENQRRQVTGGGRY